jgi:hypothetical protein
MLKWLQRIGIRARNTGSPEALLNDGLALAMDWGEDWLAPIQNRLARQHPRLSRGELDQLNAACQEAMRFAQETIHAMVRERGTNVLADPWATAENTARLFSQGMYYAWKTGGPVGGT